MRDVLDYQQKIAGFRSKNNSAELSKLHSTCPEENLRGKDLEQGIVFPDVVQINFGFQLKFFQPDCQRFILRVQNIFWTMTFWEQEWKIEEHYGFWWKHFGTRSENFVLSKLDSTFQEKQLIENLWKGNHIFKILVKHCSENSRPDCNNCNLRVKRSILGSFSPKPNTAVYSKQW